MADVELSGSQPGFVFITGLQEGALMTPEAAASLAGSLAFQAVRARRASLPGGISEPEALTLRNLLSQAVASAGRAGRESAQAPADEDVEIGLMRARRAAADHANVLAFVDRLTRKGDL